MNGTMCDMNTVSSRTENGLYSLSCCGSFTCWGSFICCAYKCRAPPLDIDREDVEEEDVGGEAVCNMYVICPQKVLDC